MSYQPVSGIVPQYSTDDNELANGYYLKFYQANTTTPLSMSTDSSGATLLVKCKLSSAGFPISNPLDNSTVFIPHVNANYRLVIYPTEEDANANNTASALVNIPDVEPMLANTVTTSTGTQTVATALDNRLVSQTAEDVAGTAALVDTGTAAGEIPLNSDLGTASLVDAIGSGDLYGRDSILGTVSETAGVPTGAIIESGSNSDGYWSQFADGTQIETVSIGEELDSSIANKGDVTNFDMDRSAPLSSSWEGASYSCHGRGIGGGGDRSDLALAGRLNENVKVYRPIGLVTSNTGDVTDTCYCINLYLQLITRWF